MTVDLDRCHALEMLGYTARQAHFLVLVALHGGYFLRRQYVAFTGTGHGLAVVRFLAQCVAREHIRVLAYGRHSHVFHLYARPLYAAIGEELGKLRAKLGDAQYDAMGFKTAGELYEGMMTSPEFPEFLTLVAYNHID